MLQEKSGEALQYDQEGKEVKEKEEGYPPQPSTADASSWQHRGSVRQPSDPPRTPNPLHCFPIIVIVTRNVGELDLYGYVAVYCKFGLQLLSFSTSSTC